MIGGDLQRLVVRTMYRSEDLVLLLELLIVLVWLENDILGQTVPKREESQK